MRLRASGGGPAWSAIGASGLFPGTLGVGSVGSVMLWLGLLLIVVIIGGLLLLLIRRWLLESGVSEDASGWDLHALRGMRDRGEISDAEFETARARIIDAFARGSATSGTVGGASSGDSPATPRAAGVMPQSGGALRAPPGFDLTGEPLPDFPGGENAASDESEGPKK